MLLRPQLFNILNKLALIFLFVIHRKEVFPSWMYSHNHPNNQRGLEGLRYKFDASVGKI